MPYDDPDASDPMTLHGVGIETHDDEAMRDMALCFIEEYDRLGFDAARILRLFANPGYAGPHLALNTLGVEVIRELVEEVSGRRPFARQAPQPEQTDSGEIALPVLE